MKTTKSILRINASMRRTGSVSRQLTDAVVNHLASTHDDLSVTTRDLADGVPFVTEAWIGANFTDPAVRTAEQRAVLSQSDVFVEELRQADIVVIGSPIYNFGVPAALKAWVDMIARAKETFRYTENGPEGLLKGKKAILVIASGGTAVGSEIDFASGYMKQALKFVGIDDVEIIQADQLGADSESKIEAAQEDVLRLAA